MRLHSIPLVGAALLLAVASSCSSDKTKQSENESIEFESYNFTRIAEQTEGDSLAFPGSEYCRVSGQGVLPVKIGKNDISALRDSLSKLAEIEFPASGVVSPVMTEGWKLTEKSDTTTACGERFNYLSMVLTTPYIIVWQDYVGMLNCGAAHGIYANRYVNYSLRNGKILNLSDLMKPGYQKRLTEMLQEKLDGNENVSAEIQEIGIPEQWRVTPDGITFIYSVYEIGPYSSGEIEVPFYLYEFEEIMTREGANLISAIPVE